MKNLPKKRWWAGAIFLNTQWNILLLEPTYKDNWEIPGGIIEENESPREACQREVQEELWLDISVWSLLCLEYQRETDDSYMFVFDGWILSDRDIEHIQLQESEIKNYHFFSLSELKEKVLPKMYTRIQNALEAKMSEKTIYYETVYNS